MLAWSHWTGGPSWTAVPSPRPAEGARLSSVSAGLTVGTITLSGNCSFDPGTVLRQTPAANTTASRGTAVNLVEATPPKPHGCAQ